MIDFPKKRESQSKDGSPIRATPIPQKDQSVFQKLKAFVKETLAPPKATGNKLDSQLKGRIQGLQQAAYEVVSELNAIKEDLENQADPDLVGTIEAVVNHIIRDVMRIEKTASNLLSPQEQAVAAERYSHWIERARPWVHLFAGQKDRHTIIQAVVKHTVHSSEETIKRDLKVIKDYQEHRLVELASSDKGRNNLEKKLEAVLTRPVEDLTRLLRSEPLKSDEIGLEGLEAWKQRFDDLRKKYYNLSMNAIDVIFQDVHPSVETAEEHDQVLANLGRIAAIEEQIAYIKQALMSSVYDEEEVYDILQGQEKEAHILKNEMEHTPEIMARLDQVHKDLQQIKEFLRASM